jgi:hypothetical protein
VLFDKRLQAKDYGAIFQHSLPRCAVRQGSTAQAPDLVAGWVRGDALEEAPKGHAGQTFQQEGDEPSHGEEQGDV